MAPHIQITLGGVAKATAFYEQLCFVRSKPAYKASVSFFQATPVVLALSGRDAPRDDAQAAKLSTGNGGIVIAQNLPSEAEVEAMMAGAEATGAHILKQRLLRRSRPTRVGGRFQSVWATR